MFLGTFFGRSYRSGYDPVFKEVLKKILQEEGSLTFNEIRGIENILKRVKAWEERGSGVILKETDLTMKYKQRSGTAL